MQAAWQWHYPLQSNFRSCLRGIITHNPCYARQPHKGTMTHICGHGSASQTCKETMLPLLQSPVSALGSLDVRSSISLFNSSQRSPVPCSYSVKLYAKVSILRQRNGSLVIRAAFYQLIENEPQTRHVAERVKQPSKVFLRVRGLYAI